MSNIIKGYHLIELNKKKINKDDLMEEIVRKDKNVKEKCLKLLDDKGFIMGVKKDKKLKVLYLFECCEDKNNGKYLSITEKINTGEAEEIIIALDNKVLESMLHLVSFNDYSKVVLEKQEIIPKTVKFGKKNISVGILIFFLFIIVGILSDNFSLWLCVGLCFAMSAGAVINTRK